MNRAKALKTYRSSDPFVYVLLLICVQFVTNNEASNSLRLDVTREDELYLSHAGAKMPDLL